MMLISLLTDATIETLYMVLLSTIFSIILGFPLGVFLVISENNGLCPMPKLNRILEFIVNILRSFPFIILMIALFPLTRLIVGTTLGASAAVVPLSIAAAPFVARITEGALKEVDYGLIEACISMGASISTIIFKVMLPETYTSLVHGTTLLIINLVGYSSMAGAIGAGGLGDLAIRFGYQRFEVSVMIYSIIIIIILVQIIQSIGNLLIKIRRKKIGKI